MTFANLPFSHISISIRWLKFTVEKFLGHGSFIYFLQNSNIFSRLRVIADLGASGLNDWTNILSLSSFESNEIF